MKSFEHHELTDQELSQMLANWTVSVPSEELRARIFADKGNTTLWQPSFLAYGEREENWYKVLFNAGRRSRSFAAALVFQICAVAFCFVVVGPSAVRQIVHQSDAVFLAPYRSKLPRATNKAGGGGGGGQHAPTPVASGAAPKYAPKPFVPPAAAVANPLLPIVPTTSATAPQIEAATYGDPLSKLTGLSPGQGVDGLGNGKTGGVGEGGGTGYGPGYSGGNGGKAYVIGGEVSAPVLIAKFEPEYSEEARKAKFSGVVVLSIVVDENGVPRNIHVVRSLGLGLDQKAIEAVQRWRFRPGVRHGKPVAVQAAVEVSFRLL